MKKLKYLLSITLFTIVNIIFITNVNAASKYSMTVDAPSSIQKGSNITLTFYAKNLSTIKNGFSGYSGTINYDSSRLEFVSITSSINGWNVYKSTPTGKVTFLGYDDNPPENTKSSDVEIFKVVFKVISLDNVNTKIEISNIKGSTSSGESLTADPITKTITIKESAVVKSNDATLSDLSVSGYNISPKFSSSTTSYKVTLPNSVQSLSVSATPNNKNAKVTITGNKNLSVGKNNIIVEVEAEDGTKKVYSIEATRSAANTNTNTGNDGVKSSNNNLSSVLGIPNLNFEPNKTEYEVTVPFETTNIEVTAKTQDPNAKVSISNGTLNNIEVDKTNTITIAVTAEDSSVKIYTFNVKRSPYKSETDLKELVVNDEDLLIKQDGSNEYKVKIPSNVDKLDISAIPVSDSSKVTIKGNQNLKDGSNTVIVEVTDKNGFTKSYTIDVEKESNNFLLNFLKNYWLLLIAILLTLFIIFLMIYLNRKNKKLIDEFNKIRYIKYSPNNVINSDRVIPNEVDNEQVIVYNSNSNIEDAYVPKHLDDDSIVSSEVVQDILNDESVSEVTKEIKFVKNEKVGSEDLEKEYSIKENIRKK